MISHFKYVKCITSFITQKMTCTFIKERPLDGFIERIDLGSSFIVFGFSNVDDQINASDDTSESVDVLQVRLLELLQINKYSICEKIKHDMNHKLLRFIAYLT